MKLMRHCNRSALCLAVCGMLVPRADLVAAGPSKSVMVKTSGTPDVALYDGGAVAGKIVDGQGHAVADAQLSVLHKGHIVARTFTGRDGSWSIRGLRGGLHQVVTNRGHMAVRLWAGDSAPPSARRALVSVTSDAVVRGQGGGAVYMDGCPQPCPTCPPCEPDPGFGCIDVITLATVGLAAAGLIVAIDNNDKLDDLASP